MKHGSCRLATAFLSAGRRRGRTRTAIPIFKKSLLSPRIIQATVKDERREAAAAAEEKEEEERLISILTGEQEEGDSKRSAAEKRGEQTKNPKKVRFVRLPAARTTCLVLLVSPLFSRFIAAAKQASLDICGAFCGGN